MAIKVDGLEVRCTRMITCDECGAFVGYISVSPGFYVQCSVCRAADARQEETEADKAESGAEIAGEGC